MSRGGEPLLSVRNLEKHYPVTKGFLNTEVGRVRAVDGISFDLRRGETLGIVGESGCGKSTAASAMIRLEEPTGGEIRFDGDDLIEYDEQELRRFRREVQMIFQDPDSSFNPRMNVGEAIAEPLIVQGMADRERRRAIVADLLERVGLSAADMERYPHEFSGGQKQRIGLARALAVNPSLIVADEPVSALDVSVQSEILKLMGEFQEDFDLTMLIISHDLGVVQEVCDRVAVMYLGEFVEIGPTEELFSDPKHPYTRALLSAIPTPDPTDRGLGEELKGVVPDPANPPTGCRFHTRCPEVIPPADVDLPQEDWRSILRFRKRLRSGTLDAEEIAEIVAVEAGQDPSEIDGDVPDVPKERIHETLYREYDLPEEVSDARTNEALQEALDRIARGDVEGAIEALDGVFVTPCEVEKPELRELATGHEASCHLHENVVTDAEALRRDLERRDDERATSD